MILLERVASHCRTFLWLAKATGKYWPLSRQSNCQPDFRNKVRLGSFASIWHRARVRLSPDSRHTRRVVYPTCCANVPHPVRGTDVMEYSARIVRSFRFEARELHNLCPLFGFVDDEFSKVGGRHGHWHATNVGEPCLNLGIGEARIELSVELVDDLGRRALRCADAVPGARLVVRHKFAYGGDVRQHL